MGMRPGPGGMLRGSGEKAKNFRGTIRKLMVYLRPYWIAILIVLAFSILSTIFAIATPKILGNMTNSIVEDYVQRTAYDRIMSQLPAGMSIPAGATGKMILENAPLPALAELSADQRTLIENLDLSVRPAIDFSVLGKTALLLIGLFLASSLFSYIQGWIMSGISQKITYELRRRIAAKINRLPLRYYDTKTHGEVLSRVTNDVDTVGQTLNQSLSQLVTSVTMIIGILAMMFSISWMLTLISIVILPLSMGIVGGIIKKSQNHFIKQQKTLGELNGHIEEMYAGHTVMKVFNGEERSIAKFTTINTTLYESAWKAQFLSGLMMPIMNFMGNLGYVGVAVVGGWLAVEGKIKIGDIQAFIQYVRQFNQPIVQTANIANVLQSTAAAAERVFAFLEETEEEADQTMDNNLIAVKGEVVFDNITFSYEPGKPVIKGFSAAISPGQRVAIVGPTGAGKTTIVNLLMRFYDLDAGTIRIDGTDISTLARAQVRDIFGMVLQDTWLKTGSIRDNIMYGNPHATEAEMVEAARAAQVDHFVHSLPGGYDFELNEEADNISQGEKQLLTIARAMLAHTPMLILDEATSSVDTRTEVLIQKAMQNLLKDKTSFVIAHRLSTIRDADLILVMRDGNIVEQGTHAELLAAKGYYAQLYESQFAGEQAA
ncbi:MAG TPA: ABC transporter ATP-binding protein [bacterium]|nr:ABC transporter ATP-binding protein [bacterium]